MKINDRVIEEVIKPELPWLVQYLNGNCSEILIKLVDLNTLSIHPGTHASFSYPCSGIYLKTDVLLMDKLGTLVDKVGGYRETSVWRWKGSWLPPFFRKVKVQESDLFIESVEQALRRIGDKAELVQFVLVLPRNSLGGCYSDRTVYVYKLPRKAKDLLTHLHTCVSDGRQSIREVLTT
jgi:hypothetical protein